MPHFLEPLHSIAGELIDAVGSDTPMRRYFLDVVFGDDVSQRIKLATNVAMASGQIKTSEGVVHLGQHDAAFRSSYSRAARLI